MRRVGRCGESGNVEGRKKERVNGEVMESENNQRSIGAEVGLMNSKTFGIEKCTDRSRRADSESCRKHVRSGKCKRWLQPKIADASEQDRSSNRSGKGTGPIPGQSKD